VLVEPTTEDLRRLVDKDRITDVLMTWNRGVERKDWDLVRACYTEDARDEHGSVNSNVQDFIEWMKSYHAHIEHVVFNATNILIEFADDDHAFVESHGTSMQRYGPEARDARVTFLGAEWADRAIPVRVHFAGRKLDQFERRDGIWRIAKRRQVYEMVDARPAEPALTLGPDFLVSRRDRTDPLYQARIDAGLPAHLGHP